MDPLSTALGWLLFSMPVFALILIAYFVIDHSTDSSLSGLIKAWLKKLMPKE